MLYSLIRPITVGFLQITADYLVKPFLTIIYNGIFQPPMILLYNVLTSISDIFEPLSLIICHILRPFGELFHEFRLVQIHIDKRRFADSVQEDV